MMIKSMLFVQAHAMPLALHLSVTVTATGWALRASSHVFMVKVPPILLVSATHASQDHDQSKSHYILVL